MTISGRYAKKDLMSTGRRNNLKWTLCPEGHYALSGRYGQKDVMSTGRRNDSANFRR